MSSITGTVRDSRNFPTVAQWTVHIESGHSGHNDTAGCPVCTWRRREPTCAESDRYTYKLDGVTYVHKSLSARYAQTPLCGFIGDGESLHGNDAYVTCPDCIAAR
jgi:hypothetical protein